MKIPVEISEVDFETYVLPHLSHKLGHNRQKISYHKVFNYILYVLKSGCSWRTLKPDNQEVKWTTIYYHYSRWSKDGSFDRLFEASRQYISDHLALESLQIDGTHTVAKKGAKK